LREVSALVDSGAEVILGAIQHHEAFVRASASTALSDSSLWVASNSDRFMPELLSARKHQIDMTMNNPRLDMFA
jgi:hypothetical protein